MAKFNPAASAAGVKGRPDATANFEGGLAFELCAKERLYTRVVTSMFGEDKFYQKGEDHAAEIRKDIAEVAKADPEFVLKLAAYARNEMYLRSAPIVLLVEAAAIPACKPFVRKWAPSIIRRADEPSEAIAYWISRHGDIGDRGQKGGKGAFPNCLKKGISDALKHFDEYQLVKHNSEHYAVKLRDVLRVCHPDPETEDRRALYRYFLTDEINEDLLPKLAARKKLARLKEFNDEARQLIAEGHVPWEVAVAQFGNRAEVWDALDLPIMAAVRNLRNLLGAGADVSKVVAKLENPKAIRRSKLLPFRFFSAHREVVNACAGAPDAGRVLAALTTAINHSVANLPVLPGVTLIACDNSGSMDSMLSRGGSVRYKDIANLFGALAFRFCERAVVGAFATDWQPVAIHQYDSVFTNMRRIEQADTKGWSTNAYRVVQAMLRDNLYVDRIILLSDMQCYDDRVTSMFVSSFGGRVHSLAELLLQYRSRINPHVRFYSIDLAGYGTAQIPRDWPNAALVAGWSDRIFQFIPAFEAGAKSAVEAIDNYKPSGERSAQEGDISSLSALKTFL